MWEWKREVDNWIWFLVGFVSTLVGAKYDIEPLILAGGMAFEKARRNGDKDGSGQKPFGR